MTSPLFLGKAYEFYGVEVFNPNPNLFIPPPALRCMPRRVESPSSLLSYKQCPRKYYYQYIEHQPTKHTIHTLRGNIVHEVLDQFFSMPTPLREETVVEQCVLHVRECLDAIWEQKKNDFGKIGATSAIVDSFYTETLSMLSLWLEKFLLKLTSLHVPVHEGFVLLTPLREQEFHSAAYSLKGYVDAIEQQQGKIRVMDYKTSSKAELTNEYRLQLGLYALLYTEKNGSPPHEVGLYFLKHADQFEQTIPVTEELLKDAQFAVETHHMSTTSDKMQDYPQKTGPLCRWSTGQCDFYELCFPKQQKLSRFQP